VIREKHWGGTCSVRRKRKGRLGYGREGVDGSLNTVKMIPNKRGVRANGAGRGHGSRESNRLTGIGALAAEVIKTGAERIGLTERKTLNSTCRSRTEGILWGIILRVWQFADEPITGPPSLECDRQKSAGKKVA